MLGHSRAAENDVVASMLKRKLIPSPLPGDMTETSLPPRPIRGSRGLFLIWFGLRIFWHVYMTKSPTKDDGLSLAQLLRHEFERLGGLWIKVARALAVHADTYSRTLRDELAKVRDFAGVVSGESIQHTVSTELDRPWNEIFREFDVVPIATTSNARLHIAWLRDEDIKVAIKIQHSGLKEVLEQDLSFLTKIAAILRFFHLENPANLQRIVVELEKWAPRLTDYRARARMMRALRDDFRSKTVYLPKVFPRYCTEHVLVMEFIDGVSLVDYNRACRRFPKKMKAWRRSNGIRENKLQKRIDALMKSSSGSVSSITIPSSLFILRDDRLALTDVDLFVAMTNDSAIFHRNLPRGRRTSSSP